MAAGGRQSKQQGWTGHIWCCDISGKVTEMDGGDLKEVEEKHVLSDGGKLLRKRHIMLVVISRRLVMFNREKH